MRHLPKDERGQASLEYLLVGLVLIALMGALAALWHFFSEGGAGALVKDATSHAMVTAGGLADALLF